MVLMKLWHIAVAWEVKRAFEGRKLFGGRRGGSVLNRGALIAVLSCCIVAGAMLAPASICAGRQAIKSYEIESKVYELCRRSTALINSQSYSQARDLMVQAAAYDPTSYSSNVH